MVTYTKQRPRMSQMPVLVVDLSMHDRGTCDLPSRVSGSDTHAPKRGGTRVRKLVCMLQQEVIGEGTDVMEMSEGVFAEALSDYPGMELAWLQMLYDNAMRDAENSPAPLSMQSVLLPSLSGFSRNKVLPTPCSHHHHTPTIIWHAGCYLLVTHKS